MDANSSPNVNYKKIEDGEYQRDGLFRILCLDGGGAKGFYTLGVLTEIEAAIGCPLYKCFDCIYGTSTGAIIAALVALGYEVNDILNLYKRHVPRLMRHWTRRSRTKSLRTLAHEVFADARFENVKTGLGIVATRWAMNRPMIFKDKDDRAHGRIDTFKPGFGVTIADAVQASCSAYPFFELTTIKTIDNHQVELGDGGFCANNPTLYAIVDAVGALQKRRQELRVISVGVGVYNEPSRIGLPWLLKKLPSVKLLTKTLEITTQSMEQLCSVLFGDVCVLRINDTFVRPDLACDMLENDVTKLDLICQQGRESFADRQVELAESLFPAGGKNA